MNKLQGKDLINVGIFTAIYFVVMMAIAMLGFIPIFLPLLIVLVPLIGGIVMMLYYSKVQKFGMVSLTGLICGILMLLTGMGYWSIITGAVFGVLADLVLKSGDYKSAKKSILGYAVFSLWMVGTYIPMYFMVEDSWASFAARLSPVETRLSMRRPLCHSIRSAILLRLVLNMTKVMERPMPTVTAFR